MASCNCSPAMVSSSCPAKTVIYSTAPFRWGCAERAPPASITMRYVSNSFCGEDGIIQIAAPVLFQRLYIRLPDDGNGIAGLFRQGCEGDLIAVGNLPEYRDCRAYLAFSICASIRLDMPVTVAAASRVSFFCSWIRLVLDAIVFVMSMSNGSRKGFRGPCPSTWAFLRAFGSYDPLHRFLQPAFHVDSQN